MPYQIAADLLVILHLGFICFVLFGGLLVLKWRWLLWVHIPAVIWGVLIEFQGWICPLTPLEMWFRQAGGEAGYTGGFVEHYILPIIYPAGLTWNIQWQLGLLVIVINLFIYGWIIKKRR